MKEHYQNEDINYLIDLFNLKEEIQEFVLTKIKKLVQEKHYFKFRGSNITHRCEINHVHFPHIRNTYETQANGTGEYFCTGKKGIIDNKKLIIVIEKNIPGNPYDFACSQGYYFFKDDCKNHSI